MPRHAFVIFAGRTRYQVQRVMPFDPSILQLFITFLLISPSLSFLQQTRVTVPTFAVELMIIPFLLISLLLPVSFIDRLSTDRANRPLIVAFHVFVTSFRRSLSRYRPQTPPDDDLYLQFRRFRRNWRSRVQDARGFFLVGIVFGFLLWLWVWIFFCLLLDCLFFWFAFWLCMASFSVCSLLACLSFCFVSCPYIRSYRFPGMFRIRSGAWHAKSAAALRCRSFPESIRRHRRDRRDIDPMAGPESSPISDGRVEDHPFPRRIDLVHWVRNRPGRPPPHFFSWTDIGSK